ncbi:hypothetical protein PACTADRAFT_48454 [Pachysolen tannophilus NRRL Y-2460]|uniref:PH domain-containing protein n=1 Tax=Pachysolen tannophilus NRRL Y-2460 TaxID=669874 RepID=A0A1E4TY22_PACTA|nr:hypothetical protein PACTADRAFT_48454 [Pachysolen tannophilus NRRL Y-2460]
MKNYSKLINTEIESVKISLINDLSDNFLQNNQSIDWNYFINNDNNKNFIKIDNTDALKIKKLSDISYPYQQKLLGKCIRSGYLEKKSKFLKNYSRFFYVLTLNYFHEFKTNDRKKDPYPISSINLNQCVLTDYENDRKLILHTRNNNGSTMNYVFKCNDSKELTKWYNDLKELTSFNDSIERNRYFELKYKDGYNNSINSSSSASTDFTKNSGSTNQSSISGSSGDLQGSTLSLPKINNNANSSTGNFLKNHKKSSSSSSSLLQKSLNFNQSLPKPKSATNLSNLKNNALSTGSGGSSSFSDTSTLNTPGSDSTPRAEDAHKAGQITMHLNLSNQNLIPNIVVGESPSGLDTASSRSTPTNTLRVSGRPIPGEGGDYFGNIANNSTSQGEGGTRHSSLPIVASNSSNSSLTNMRNQGAATSPSGQRTPPVANKNNKKFNYRIQLPSPQGNLNQMVMHMNSNGGTPNPGNIPQTPGELPNHSVSEIINDFQHTHIDNANYDEEHNNTQ